MPGIPDTSVVSYKYHGDSKEFEFAEFWLELKAQQSSNVVVLRPAQFQWLLKRSHIGAHCWVANEHPLLKQVTMWKFYDGLAAEKSGVDKIKITEKPLLKLSSVEAMIATHPSKFLINPNQGPPVWIPNKKSQKR